MARQRQLRTAKRHLPQAAAMHTMQPQFPHYYHQHIMCFCNNSGCAAVPAPDRALLHELGSPPAVLLWLWLLRSSSSPTPVWPHSRGNKAGSQPAHAWCPMGEAWCDKRGIGRAIMGRRASHLSAMRHGLCRQPFIGTCMYACMHARVEQRQGGMPAPLLKLFCGLRLLPCARGRLLMRSGDGAGDRLQSSSGGAVEGS